MNSPINLGAHLSQNQMQSPSREWVERSKLTLPGHDEWYEHGHVYGIDVRIPNGNDGMPAAEV